MLNFNQVIIYDPLIISGGYPPAHESPMAQEDGLKIYPGDLLELVDGAVKPHSAADSATMPKYVADINPLNPMLIRSKHPLDEYAIYREDDPEVVRRIHYFTASAGQKLYMRLGAGVEVSDGESLVSAGDGTLKVTTASDNSVFGVARETLVGGAEPMRILVEVV